jgi:hypothetical protein
MANLDCGDILRVQVVLCDGIVGYSIRFALCFPSLHHRRSWNSMEFIQDYGTEEETDVAKHTLTSTNPYYFNPW